jgi:selenocysteine-specific elongation factor
MQSSQQGISEPALSRATNFKGSHLLFHNLLQHLIDSAEIKRTGTLLHLVAHVAQMSDEEKNFLNKIRPILQKTGNVPPRTRELEEMTNIPLKPLERILKQTTLAGNLIQVAPNRYYLPDTIMDLAEITEKLIQQYNSDEGFSVIQFRDKTGIGRNLCIEILEYFDRVGFTRRDGNSRFVRTEKENIFGK